MSDDQTALAAGAAQATAEVAAETAEAAEVTAEAAQATAEAAVDIAIQASVTAEQVADEAIAPVQDVLNAILQTQQSQGERLDEISSELASWKSNQSNHQTLDDSQDPTNETVQEFANPEAGEAEREETPTKRKNWFF